MNLPLERYFDAAASTPLDPRVRDAMVEVMDVAGNNNSKHCYGFAAQDLIDKSLATIAEVLQVSSDQLAVTYAGTDANRRFLWECGKRFGQQSLWCSAVEHSSVVDEVPESNRFDPRDFSAIPKSAKVLALMGANSETGAIYPGETLRKDFPESLILRDYSQSFPKGIFPDLQNCDAGVFTPQKFYGPKHVGLLYLKQPELFPEISKDSHTKNVFLIVGMAKAFEIWQEEKEQNVLQLQKWTQQIEDFIVQNIPDFKIHEQDQDRIPGLVNVAFAGVRGSELMAILSDQERVAISTGSACTSDILSPTEVIRFLEPDPKWQYPIRISLHKFLTDEAVGEFCEMLAHYVEELRGREI